MNTRRGLALFFLVSFPPSALAADAAAASKQLEAARSALSQAVEKIKPDPPSNADLDAAHDAVEKLKAAIDAGAELEQSDLDYAKAALAARKELRTLRDWVDTRRANVKIFDARRALDGTVKALNEAAAKLTAKEPTAKDFADARTAADAVKKLVDDARPFGKVDAKFNAFLNDTDALVAKQLRAADERETNLGVEKQRAALEPLRQTLKDAVAALGKEASDDDFKAGDTAAKALLKQLDDGKALEAKHKGYGTEAGKLRAEHAAAKKKMDEAWTATGLQRLKAEIDPQYRDLLAAAKPLKGKPTADQLAEARTAAIVVRGLVEKFQPEAERSQAFGQYVEQVRRALVDTETQIEQRSLTAAQLDVGIAQRAVEAKGPSDEQFQEYATAITVLEKTLATVHAKEPAMAKSVGEATWVIGEARKIIERRRLEVDVERQIAKTNEARRLATDAMTALGDPKFGHEQVQQAESSIKLIGTVLEKGEPLIEKDKTYAWYDGDTKKKIAELEGKLAAKKIQLAAREAGQALADAQASAKQKLDTAKAPEGKDSDLEGAIAAVEAINTMLEKQAPLEKQNGNYAAQAEKARNALYGLTDTLEFTKLARELRKKTGEALMTGVATNDKAATLKNLRERKGKYEASLGLFKSCQSEGQQLTKMLPQLAKLPVLVDGKTLMPLAVMDLCTQRVSETQTLMKEVAPLIKFEDGPKKSYEAGKTLMDKSKKAEALAQYNECIATGIILQHDYPEMGEKKFDVVGGSLTLTEIINFCVGQRKQLTASK